MAWTEIATLQGAPGRGYRDRGPWATGVNYLTDDLAQYDGSTYRATADHTAGAAFTGDATNWSLWASKGADGAPGPGVPAGGTTGQIPAKASNADYDVHWIDAPTGGGGGTAAYTFVGGTDPEGTVGHPFTWYPTSDGSADETKIIDIKVGLS